MSAGLTFTCVGCQSDIDVESTDDDLPDVLVKFRRVERACRACGHTAVGIESPDECPNDRCNNPNRGWTEADRIVTTQEQIPLCEGCQEALMDMGSGVEKALRTQIR